MRARFSCLPPWAWLTIIILTECVLLSAWLCREYFVFDYTCFMVQINQDSDSGYPSKIHLVMELPDEALNQPIYPQEVSANSTMAPMATTTSRKPPRRRKRPLRSRNYSQRNIESVVKIEPLLSLYPDTDEQVPFKTKTTWNKYHKQMSQRLHRNSTKNRRKKKRPVDVSRRRATSNMKSTVRLPTTTPAVIEFTVNSTEWAFKEFVTTTDDVFPVDEIQMIDENCKRCQERSEGEEGKSKTFDDQASRWRTHGVGGPNTNSPKSLNFTEQLQNFASNAICVGRTMADFWSGAQVLAAFPFLVGIRLKARCLFTPYLVLSSLFLVVMFVYAATLTIFSLLLFTLVEEMRVEIMLNWMLFAAVLDSIFVFGTLIFVLTLQNCDILLTEYQQEQIVELPDTIKVEPDVIQRGDGEQKKQRSKSLLYSQLAVEDFLNGGP